MMKAKNYKIWFNVTILIVWVVICNICVTDAMLLTLHNFAGVDSHLTLDRDNHTNYHLGHSIPHQHEGMPDHEPHGLNSSNIIVFERQALTLVNNEISIPNSVILDFTQNLLPEYLSNTSKYWNDWNDCNPSNAFQYQGSISTRAPPILL